MNALDKEISDLQKQIPELQARLALRLAQKKKNYLRAKAILKKIKPGLDGTKVVPNIEKLLNELAGLAGGTINAVSVNPEKKKRKPMSAAAKAKIAAAAKARWAKVKAAGKKKL